MSIIEGLSRLSEVPRGTTITMIVYGGPGTGKTRFACTTGPRTLYIECEGRISTQQSYAKTYGFNPIFKQVTEESLPDGGSKALEQISTILKDASTNYSKEFDVIVIDGATALRRFAMNKALELLGFGGKSKTLEKVQLMEKKFGDTFGFADVGVQDFGGEMQMIEKFIYKLTDYCRNENKHLLFTAHQRETYGKALDKNGNAIIGQTGPLEKIRPGFTGQTFPDTIPGMFDFTWYSEVIGSDNNKKYRVRTEGDSKLVAKTCVGENGSMFPTLIENPNFLKVIKAVQEQIPYAKIV